ncbi:zinc transport system substrate-binding protein [Georgenia soli]|uniref:Zinc transport system substrate-binding protein n=1 Tax=Georgenia soli TaxID=638953 RepID=A0A2A9EQZ0_9MICO|nr:metal ABC transporter substrate-binding protein [Georgenia soli]PFG41298.1 zinc transport system substrate-binding protein [Georgenia soli]
MTNLRHRAAAALAVLALPLAACSDLGSAGAATDGRTHVLTALYPLEYVTKQVGGEHVTVSSVTPAGVDPHDLELAPATVAKLDGATVVYLSGFQAALDDALAVTSPAHVLDVAGPAGVHTDGDGHAADEDGHADEPAGTDDGHGHTDGDPHFWLDPSRLADVATAVAGELADADPEHAADYAANAERLGTELAALDQEYADRLARCETRTIVVAHEAYGYLAEAYGLKQVGISGVDPESEPSPARLAQIGDVVKDQGVTTIFTESLVNPAVAESLASDLGVDVAVLDPLETQVDQGREYPDVMRANLDALTTAMRCS